MSLDVLKGELERLFELEQLKDLAERLLGVALEESSDAMGKAGLASALVARCVEAEAVEALCDAVVTLREGVARGVSDLRARGYTKAQPLRFGDLSC